MVRVLFVCLGNICRSPMAEAVFRQLVREADLTDKIQVDSAGTGHWHVGEPAHYGTRSILTHHNIPCHATARLLLKADLNAFDYILAMDRENLHDIESLGNGSAKVALLMDYVPEAQISEVPDPYYTGAFDAVFELVKAGAEGLLRSIREEHGI